MPRSPGDRLPLPRSRFDFGILALAGLAALIAAAGSVLVGPMIIGLPFALAAVVVLVRYPILLYICFLSVGVFKGLPVFQAVPVDLTLAFGGLLAIVCAWRLFSAQGRTLPFPLVAAMVAIGVLMTLSLTYTPIFSYGSEKVFKFWTFTMIAALAPFFIIRTREDLRVLLWAIAGMGVIGAMATLAFGTTPYANAGDTANGGRLILGGVSETIFLSRLLCAGAIVFLLVPLVGLGGRWRYASIGAGTLLSGVALLIGSRGPIISLVFGLVITALALGLRRPATLAPIAALLVVVTLIFPFISLPETSKQRLTGAASNPVGTLQSDGRDVIYHQAILLWQQHPFRGIGAGGFFQYSFVLADAEERYPHNIFLELASEEGTGAALIMVALAIATLLGIYRRAWREDGDPDRGLVYIVGALFVFNLLAVQFSGDINDNRAFWAATGLAWLLIQFGLPPKRADLPA
jgi:O-antigen ligase